MQYRKKAVWVDAVSGMIIGYASVVSLYDQELWHKLDVTDLQNNGACNRIYTLRWCLCIHTLVTKKLPWLHNFVSFFHLYITKRSRNTVCQPPLICCNSQILACKFQSSLILIWQHVQQGDWAIGFFGFRNSAGYCCMMVIQCIFLEQLMINGHAVESSHEPKPFVMQDECHNPFYFCIFEIGCVPKFWQLTTDEMAIATGW